MSAMRTVIYKNYNKNDDKFNIDELKVRKVAFIIWITLISVLTGFFTYNCYNSLRFDLGYVDGTKIQQLDYNLKLLSLQIESEFVYFSNKYIQYLSGILTFIILGFLPVSIFFYMAYYMNHHQNYQFNKDKKNLYSFFIAVVISLILACSVQFSVI